jgi:hypothetical protein
LGAWRLARPVAGAGVRSQAEGRRVFAFDPTRLITERMHPLWAIDDLRRVVGAAIWMHRRMNLLP